MVVPDEQEMLLQQDETRRVSGLDQQILGAVLGNGQAL